MKTDKALIRIVDDDEEFACSQRLLLSSLGWEVVTYPNAAAFLASDDLSRLGCLILDVRMPGMTGLELQQILERKGCDLPIIFLSAHGDIAMAVHTVRHGAVDFLEKPVEPQTLLSRVTAAIAASIKYSVENEEILVLRERMSKLSPREYEIAKLVGEGLRNKEIARKLNIEETTVKMHRAHAMAKLCANTGAELTRMFTIVELKTERTSV